MITTTLLTIICAGYLAIRGLVAQCIRVREQCSVLRNSDTDRNSLLGYAFWALVLAVGIFHRLVRHIFHALDIRAGQWARSRVRWLWIPLDGTYHWLQTHLVVPAPLPSSRRKLLWWTFPTRIEAVTVLLFWVLSVVVCTLEYRPVEGNL